MISTGKPVTLRDQRERVAHPAILGAYLIIPFVLVQIDDPLAFKVILPSIAVVAFIAWLLSLRRMMMMEGTPTSKIASAAQGYVELVGLARVHPAGPLRSRFTGLPCVWYQYVIQQKNSDGKWQVIESGRSDDSFLLDDGSGTCLVDPENAEILPRQTDVMTVQSDYRHTESLILPNEKIYAIGQFSTIGGENVDLNVNRDVGELLAEWKRNKPALLQRFDLDKDGQISEKEWALARSQAKRDVRKTHNAIRTQPGTHMLHQPRDGRLFLISNIDPQNLQTRYKSWAWVHLAVAIAAVAATAWVGK